MCGLRKRSNYPDFFEHFAKFDIVCFTEVKIDETDEIVFPGYTAFKQPRKQSFIRRSGGITAYVKDNLAKYVTELKSESDYILWLSLDKKLSRCEENYILGVVYIPPESSNFYNDDETMQLESEISTFCAKYSHVILTGDFNSRTSSQPDYIETDEFFSELFDFDAETAEFFSHINKLECLNILKDRRSQDSHVNNHGHRLLDLCRNNNLFILNGRLGQDRGIGRFTFRNASVIDYMLATAPVLEKLTNFEILEVDPIFSDGHSQLSATLTITRPKQKEPIKTDKKQSPRWDDRYIDQFCRNINPESIDEIKDLLNIPIPTKESVNKATDMMANIFQNSRDISFPLKKTHSFHQQNKTKNKPWFGPKCKLARKKYHLAKRLHKTVNSTASKQNLNQRSKDYKRTMDNFISKYRKDNERKLRKMQSKNPKDYWKLLNKWKSSPYKSTPTLEQFLEHFENINQSQHEEGETINFDLNNNDEILNSKITRDEILHNINKLKNGKATGHDEIANEYIKSTKHILLPTYELLFNTILDTGYFPEQWTIGIIKPIYKNKGDNNDVKNYRPITILSCLGKLFTSILNERLTSFMDETMRLSENQAGFRKEYSTLDHIFSLNAIIEILKHRKKKLFCCFVDFSSAFDSIWRVGLWQKVIHSDINGKILRVIYNMYYDIKSCVSLNSQNSSFFASFCGVRQGENLSPILFSIYLNDLHDFLIANTNLGIPFDYESDLFATYFRLIVLLYADDTVLISDNETDLQNTLNIFFEYCETWKLKVNIDKTKIIIFGAKKTNHLEFRLGNAIIEIVERYKYLGVFFSNSRSFINCRKHVVAQAKKATHLLFYRINNIHLPLDLQLKLFGHTVVPILTYACEIWGFENTNLIENVHTEFLRKITKTRKSTPLYMLYAELGRYPLAITIKTRVIGFWNKLICGKFTKLSFLLYQVLKCTENLNSKWIDHVKNILCNAGRNDLWLNQTRIASSSLKHIIKQILLDQFLQEWHQSTGNSTKGLMYRSIKEDIHFEEYLNILPKRLCINMIRFRTANHSRDRKMV